MKRWLACALTRLEGIETMDGRPTYKVSFSPKPGRLAWRGYIEKALNHVRGRIWIDSATYEIARLEFELMEKTRFGWFLGSVSELKGFYARNAVDGVWLPSHGELSLEARALFRTIRRRQRAEWTDFVPWSENSSRCSTPSARVRRSARDEGVEPVERRAREDSEQHGHGQTLPVRHDADHLGAELDGAVAGKMEREMGQAPTSSTVSETRSMPSREMSFACAGNDDGPAVTLTRVARVDRGSVRRSGWTGAGSSSRGA